ncbi:MAG: TetR family transcriptional regulator [Actinobacteria bacterium]|nr:MAG: TetR family transcriptional regulator [Actinomycetota bacterium]
MYSEALKIVDAEGLEALSMRRLAREVGVEAASLYHHVPNKDALIDGMVIKVRSEVRVPDPVPEDWIDLFVAIFAEFRRVNAEHPNLVMYAARGVDSDPQPSGFDFLRQIGFSAEDAIGLWQSMIAFSTGFSLFSSGFAAAGTAGMDPALAERMSEWRDETCDRTLRTIIEGYARTLPTR